MKIMVIGYSGSGKSTLARYLGKKYQTPVLHLDHIFWLPGWKERPREEMKKIVTRFLDSHTSWIIDGNYRKTEYERRLAEADRIICRSIAFLVCTGYGNAIKNIGEERDGIWGMGVWKSWIGNLFNGFFGKEEMRRTGQHTRRFRKDILERFL